MGIEGDREAPSQMEEEGSRHEMSEVDDQEEHHKTLLDRWVSWAGIIDR